MVETAIRRADGIGASMLRTEDKRLTTGKGRYTDDYAPPGLCYAAVVRSPHAHARIRAIDSSEALASAGVLTVLTGEDVAAEGLKPIPHNVEWTGAPDVELQVPDDFEVYTTDHPILPLEIVRYVGEGVAIVVAETAAQAADGAELVAVDYEPLPVVTDARAALVDGQPQIWPDCAGNLSFRCEVGDKAATDAAFATAEHVIALDTWVNRITGSPMEPRVVVGEYDAERDHYTLYTGSGRGVVQNRERLAYILNKPLENCRAVFGDMGGNFGTRNAFSPEYALIPWAASKIGRPLKWVATRGECFLSDYQGRDLAVSAELAMDADGKFLAMRGINTLNLGAYAIYFWPLRKGLSIMQGTYVIPSLHFEGRAVYTNTPPIAVYRSAGRPEAIYVIERLIDMAADQCGFDRVELRQRNLIEADALPFQNAVGVTYDSGDYPACMQRTQALADWSGYAGRQAESAARGLCRGIGLANYIEVTSGIPRERAEIRVCEDGFVDLVVGTMSSGQGHETSFPQLVSQWLEVPFDRVRFVANDTNRVSVGGGSHSGRSMRLVSIAVAEAVESLVAKGKAIAGHVLQAAPADIRYGDGAFTAPDGGSIDLYGVAEAAAALNSLDSDLRGVFESIGDITDRAGGYPYGTHICEVEVDPETGLVQIVSWSGVDDVGLAVNPMILHGQAHGAIAQGLGQALLEDIVYEPESGQLLSGSFMDYAMPRADNTPAFAMEMMEIPATSHPHGIRPGGEGGTTPALGLVINAIVDALKDYGVKHIEMPATPERVWRAINEARKVA